MKVDIQHGGKCPDCGRVVQPEAIRHAMSATVTVGDLAHATALQLSDAIQEDLFVGSVLGHFRLDRPLGRGGMGTVYRALDTSLQRYVAVKVVKGHGASDSADAQQVNSMLQEAIAQARLNHPNVVTIYYVGRQDGLPFLAMELVTGPTLHERLKLGSLPYADVIEVGLQVADALRHASQFGIVHADIKPSNLLISSENQIKLSDFGLSRVADDSTSAKISGTPAYLAPELVDGENLSIQSDMYALGVTLFELLFGRLPYELLGESLRERLETHRTASIEYPDPWPLSIPIQVKAVLSKLMAKNPADRYSNYDLLIGDLKRLMPVDTTSAGLAARVSAYGVDQVMLLASIVPFVVGVVTLVQIERLGWYSWLVPLLGLLAFVPPAIYLAAIRSGWRSLGCYLFQLRTVDGHGLPLRRDLRFTREILRCMFTWLFPLSIYAGLFWEGIDTMVDFGILVFFVIDIASFFVTTNRTTLHDWLCGARVVLDVHRHHGIGERVGDQKSSAFSKGVT